MITYYELGGQRRLNEIVVAGSHDAGVKDGGQNVQTQRLDILGQAMSGVRVFDLRIAAQSTAGPAGGPRQATMRAFHSSITRTEDKSRFATDVGRMAQLTRTKVVGGAFGEPLSDMLNDARDFVQNLARNEFLILKFDKCTNWGLIAETCADRLGDAIYQTRGNVNTRTLAELRGKVVVVFSTAGMREVRARAAPGQPAAGIKEFKNLHAGGCYEPNFDGLQYYGKGGTKVYKPYFKIRQNEKTQRKILEGAKEKHRDILSMMYWTTTGVFESIRARNDRMWDSPKVNRMKKLWAGGLREHTDDGLIGSHVHRPDATALRRRGLMPNIVMIDFADETKCRTIRELNDLTDDQIAALQA